jgi:hypothetical protein
MLPAVQSADDRYQVGLASESEDSWRLIVFLLDILKIDLFLDNFLQSSVG